MLHHSLRALPGSSQLLHLFRSRRLFSAASLLHSHENPLGLPPRPASSSQTTQTPPRSRFPAPSPGLPHANSPPSLPRRGGLPTKKRIAHVGKVIVVSSGKGGVGKSTVAVNLALALAQLEKGNEGRKLRVGVLDLDIYGPSVPLLMGLQGVGEPELSKDNALLPLSNHGISCMSIGFLLPPSADGSNPVVWRGMMVMKAVQQLLFDVDWRGSSGGEGLDAVVIDMPPGTGDVALSLGQLVEVDGAVIVSTPQDVALLDARKGVSTFRKLSIPILGAVLNMSHFICPHCTTPHELFGSSQSFHSTAAAMNLQVLGSVPLESATSARGDQGRPVMLGGDRDDGESGKGAREGMRLVARQVWKLVQTDSEG